MFGIYFYKSTKTGLAGIYNRAVRIVTKGQYSHCEIHFSDGMSASSSFADGGVRFKKIIYDPAKWDFMPLPQELEPRARQYFIDNEGKGYDLLGNVHFAVPVVGDSKDEVCCSEACGESIDVPDAWRFHPNSLACVIGFIFKVKV